MVLNDISKKKIPHSNAFFILSVKDDWVEVRSIDESKKKPHFKLKVNDRFTIRITDAFKLGAKGWHMSDLLIASLIFAGLPPKGISTIVVDNVKEKKFRKIWDEGSRKLEELEKTPLLKMVTFFAKKFGKKPSFTIGEFFALDFIASLK